MSRTYVLEASDVFPIKVGNDPETDGREPETFWQVLDKTMQKYADKPALVACAQIQERDKGKYYTSGSEQIYTFKSYYAKSWAFGKALLALGFKEYSAVNIIGFNSPEWIFAQVGCMLARGVAAGIYATNNPAACQYVAAHSEAEVIVVEGEGQLNKFVEIMKDQIEGGLPHLKALVAYNLSPEDCEARAAEVKEVSGGAVTLYEWNSFLKTGESVDDADLKVRMEAQVPGNCCTLIYTSGTTGNPKAVMISHDNATWTVAMLAKSMGGMYSTDKTISYLPLSHIAAQILDVFGPANYGSCVYFARPDALKGTITMTLQAVHPNIFFGVPRVWQKIAAKMQAMGRSITGLKKTVSTWAKGIGAAYSEAKQGFAADGTPNTLAAYAPCCYSGATCIVLGRIKSTLGLDQCRACITAAAPIAKETLEYFAALDIPLYEVYGQSECTGPATLNTPHYGWKIGSVGRVLPGTTMRLDAETQEIQYTGRHIFMGYMKMEGKTKDTFTDDGWLASGDQGAFDADKCLAITGRIKELIIGAGGENIAPVLIEKVMKKIMPWLSNAIVFGDNKKFLGMFVSLETEPDENGFPSDKLTGLSLHYAGEIGSTATTYSEAKTCEKFKKAITEGMKLANASGEPGIVSRAAQPKFFMWLPKDLTPLGDKPTLTSTLKLKRSVVNKMYQDIIDAKYDELINGK